MSEVPLYQAVEGVLFRLETLNPKPIRPTTLKPQLYTPHRTPHTLPPYPTLHPHI